MLLSGILSNAVYAGVVPYEPAQASGSKNAISASGKSSRSEAVCSQCHGIVTPSTEAPFPQLAGQDATYLETALKQYRDKTRRNDLMNAIAGSLTDQDIREVAGYYSKLNP